VQSVKFVSNSGDVGAFVKHGRVNEEKRKKWQRFPWMGCSNCARRRRAVAEVSFDGVPSKPLMKSRFKKMAESKVRPQEAVVGCYQWSGRIRDEECADGEKDKLVFGNVACDEQTQVILQDLETSRNRYGNLRTLSLRSRSRFGEARATTQAIAHTSVHESFGSSFAARMIMQLDYFEFALDETRTGSIRRDGHWTAFVKYSTKTEGVGHARPLEAQ
jgi:hypothetical protein